MTNTMEEVLQFVDHNDVKFIRLVFCDIFGSQKNIAIMPSELPRAFEQGISFDASAEKGFLNIEKSDLFLFPDPSTLDIMPWRPSHGRVVRFFCDIKYPDGQPFEGDTRYLLKQAIKKAEQMGFSCKIGSECEFYLFELDERGNPTFIPQDHASYCDIAPLDKGENVRRDICLTLEEMGILPESSHHEQGPGQNEIIFKHNDALSAADDLVTFKSVVKAIALRNGLYASFMPKPVMESSGNGLHVNLSLLKNGINLFDHDPEEHNQDCEYFIAGILAKCAELTTFLNPITNSYKRLGSFEAPRYITWSHQNCSPLIRIPAATGEYSRMELRSPDPSCNPYLAFALLIYAGLYGIEQKIRLPQSCDTNLFQAQPSLPNNIPMLPGSLEEALNITRNSTFVSSCIPENTLKKYLSIKYRDCAVYDKLKIKSNADLELYFKII